MTDDYLIEFQRYRDMFEKKLDDFLLRMTLTPDVMDESFKYSLRIGGKRIRPVIMLATAEYLGVRSDDVMDYALAIELIHTYSLIHDDLPEMDNSDYRRGEPSSHKKFGAGYAVLAGDSLLNTAYSILFKNCCRGPEFTKAASVICDSAGIDGMIAGQYADIYYERSPIKSPEILELIYEKKTAKLIAAAFLVPSVIAGEKYYAELSELGRKLGYLFQLTDDILDVEGTLDCVGKDIGNDKNFDKLTVVSVYGLKKSKTLVAETGSECMGIIDGMGGDTAFFKGLVCDLCTRLK